MVQSEPGPECQEPKRDCSDMKGQHHVLTEEGQATHDFLSIHGSSSARATVAVGKSGSKAGVTTQDLLQPLQTNLFTASSATPTGFLTGGPETHSSSGVCNAGGKQTSINLINRVVDMQPDYKSLDISHISKLRVPNDVVSVKNWQQQHSHLGFETLDRNTRLAQGLSEEEEDDDDVLDHGYFLKKEIGVQKLDNVQQQLEGKSLDNKGLTSRSKHSATEQRRRSKINDRFQMLRKLLPNSDQKRDKASFLLEVVEYIKMLHETVRKYETTECFSQPRGGEKTLPWDRKSICKEGLVNVSDGSLATMIRYDAKETSEENGYTTYLSSPSRVAQEDGKINPDGGPSSLFVSRVLPASLCLPGYEDTSVVSMPTFLSFATPLSNSTEEPPTPTFSTSRSQSYRGGPTSTAPQALHAEEQAALGAKVSPAWREEASAPARLHQTSKASTSKWGFSLDPNHELYKSPECTPRMLCDRGPNEVVDEQLRSSALKDVSAMRLSRNIGRPNEAVDGPLRTNALRDVSARRLSGDVEDELSCGLNIDVDEKLIYSNRKSPKGDHAEQNLVDASAVLGGVVNISSPYSQGLLDTLTRALQTAGIDLAQASISVQVDLGKPRGSSLTSYKETATLNATILPGQSTFATESERPTKRPKVED